MQMEVAGQQVGHVWIKIRVLRAAKRRCFSDLGVHAARTGTSGLAARRTLILSTHGQLLPSYFHLHLIRMPGETLTTMAKAAAVQYSQVRPIEHVHPSCARQAARARAEGVEQSPGIVLTPSSRAS